MNENRYFEEESIILDNLINQYVLDLQEEYRANKKEYNDYRTSKRHDRPPVYKENIEIKRPLSLIFSRYQLQITESFDCDLFDFIKIVEPCSDIPKPIIQAYKAYADYSLYFILLNAIKRNKDVKIQSISYIYSDNCTGYPGYFILDRIDSIALSEIADRYINQLLPKNILTKTTSKRYSIFQLQLLGKYPLFQANTLKAINKQWSKCRSGYIRGVYEFGEGLYFKLPDDRIEYTDARLHYNRNEIIQGLKNIISFVMCCNYQTISKLDKSIHQLKVLDLYAYIQQLHESYFNCCIQK